MDRTGLSSLAAAILIAAASPAEAQQAPTGSWAAESAGNAFYMGGSASDGTYLYLIGGYQDLSATPYLYYQQLRRYDPANNSWTTLALLPYPTYYNAGAYYDGRIFSFGGYYLTNSGGTWVSAVTNMIHAYDIASNSWTTLSATLTGARYLHAAATTPTPLGDRIYITGGATTNANDEFNPSTDSVASRAAMPVTAYYHAMAAVPSLNKVYVAGGYLGGAVSAACYEYTPPDNDPNSPADNSWTAKAPMTLNNVQQPRYGARALTLNGSVYVTGGYAGGSSAQTFEYNPESDAWAQRAGMSNGRYLHGAAVVNGQGYVYGGYVAYNSGEEYTPPDFGKAPTPASGVTQEGTSNATTLQAIDDPIKWHGWTGSQVTFKANVSDPDAGQPVRFRVRVKSVTNPTWTHLDSGLTAQGPVSVVYSIPATGDYDWEYRVEDSYLNSHPKGPNTWLPAFGNAISPDFRSDQIPPTDPVAGHPDQIDIQVPNPDGGYVTLTWLDSADNGPISAISYEIMVARDVGFLHLDAQIFSTVGCQEAPVFLTDSRHERYWRMRARDVGGNFTAWTLPRTFSATYNDGLDHGAGDSNKTCAFSAFAAARSLTGLLLGLAILARATHGRSRK